MERHKRFLGSGWRFPVGSNQDGGVDSSAYEDNVEQNILIILGTAPGERQMRPDFGCKIHDLVFRPNNRMTANLAESYVRMAIQKWEPRVGEVSVKANPDAYEQNRMRIDVAFTMAGSNVTRNMVYPFYLEGHEEEE